MVYRHNQHNQHSNSPYTLLRRKYRSEYMIWVNMKQRCLNHNNRSYYDYGGRGITVCHRWRNSFENFLEDMDPRPSPELTLERNNNDGNYEPDNCKWATRKEQSQNRRIMIKKQRNYKLIHDLFV
jgi:hypothetical protein